MSADKKSTSKIFVGGLSFSTTDGTLKTFFGKYGEVVEAIVMKDPATKRSRGFGFVVFAHNSAVDRVLHEHELRVDGRKVDAKRAVPRGDDGLYSNEDIPESPKPRGGTTQAKPSPPGPGSPVHSPSHPAPKSGATSNTIHGTASSLSHRKIFAGGLHYGTDEDSLRHYFGQYGKISAAQVMYNRETCKSRGFGFVIFEDETSVDRVLTSRLHVIDEKTVEVKRAVPKSDSSPVPGDGGTPVSPSTPKLVPHKAETQSTPPPKITTPTDQSTELKPKPAPKPLVPAWGPNRGSILEKLRQPAQDSIPEDAPVNDTAPTPTKTPVSKSTVTSSPLPPPRPLNAGPSPSSWAGKVSQVSASSGASGLPGSEVATPPRAPVTSERPASTTPSGMPRRASRSSSIVLSSCAASVGSSVDEEPDVNDDTFTNQDIDDFADNPFIVEEYETQSRGRFDSALGSLDDEIVVDDRRSRSGSDALSSVSSAIGAFKIGQSSSMDNKSTIRAPGSPVIRKLSTDAAASVSSRLSFASSLAGPAPSSPFANGLSLADILTTVVAQDSDDPQLSGLGLSLPGLSTPSRPHHPLPPASVESVSVGALTSSPRSFPLFGSLDAKLRSESLPESLSDSLRDISSVDGQNSLPNGRLTGVFPASQADLDNFDIGQALAAGLMSDESQPGDRPSDHKATSSFEPGTPSFPPYSAHGHPNGGMFAGSSSPFVSQPQSEHTPQATGPTSPIGLRKHVSAPEFVSQTSSTSMTPSSAGPGEDRNGNRRPLNPHAVVWNGSRPSDAPPGFLGGPGAGMYYPSPFGAVPMVPVMGLAPPQFGGPPPFAVFGGPMFPDMMPGSFYPEPPFRQSPLWLPPGARDSSASGSGSVGEDGSRMGDPRFMVRP